MEVFLSFVMRCDGFFIAKKSFSVIRCRLNIIETISIIFEIL